MTEVAPTITNVEWSRKLPQIDVSSQSNGSQSDNSTIKKTYKYLEDGMKIIGKFVEENYSKMDKNEEIIKGGIIGLLKKDFQFLIKVSEGWQKLVRETLKILQPEEITEIGVIKLKPFNSFTRVSEQLQKQSSMVFELQIQNESIREELIESQKKVEILQRKSKILEPTKESWHFTAPKKPSNFDDISTPFPRGYIQKGSFKQASTVSMDRSALQQEVNRLHATLHKLREQYQSLKLITEQKSYSKPISRCQGRDLQNGRKVSWDIDKIHQETDLPLELSPFVKRHFIRKTLRYPINNSLSLPSVRLFQTPQKKKVSIRLTEQ